MPGAVDLVDIFRRPQDLHGHLDDIDGDGADGAFQRLFEIDPAELPAVLFLCFGHVFMITKERPY